MSILEREAGHSARSRERTVDARLPRELGLLLIVWLATGAWVWARLDQGWVHHDDGAFAQSAARVLDGQLPHREFAELYTGGLTFLNAGVFAVFGENLIVLRYPLLVAFLALVPVTYYVVRHVARPAIALLASVTAAVWSIPVYPAAVPSWYQVVLAMCGVASLVRWRETSHTRWVFACGLAAGISVSFKIVGVYFVVAAVLFLLYAGRDRPATRRRLDPPAILGLLLAFALTASVLGGQLGAPELLNFVIPIVAVCVAFAVQRSRTLALPGEGQMTLRAVGALFAGVLVPLTMLAVPYVVAGAVGDLVEGVVLSPQSRREFAYVATPIPGVVLAALVAWFVTLRGRMSPRTRSVVDASCATVVIAVVVVAAWNAGAYTLVLSLARGVGPVAVILGSWWLVRGRWLHEPLRRDLVFLALCVLAFVSLVQFPFGAAVYYCYVAPLVVVAVAALAGSSGRQWGLALMLGAATLFGAAYLDRASLSDLGERFVRDGQVTVLDPERASIRVYPAEAAGFREVVALLRRHGEGEYVFAGPDLPELYFLSGFQNPTRALFDFLDRSHSSRGPSLLTALRDRGVTAIAINREPDLSPPLEATTLRTLERLYPLHVRVGNVDVRWRAAPERPRASRPAEAAEPPARG